MTKQVIKFGPWTGGMDATVEEPTLNLKTLADSSNIEIDPDGTIKLRRPYRAVDSGAEFRLLGISPLPSDTFEGIIGTGVIYRKNSDIYLIYPTAGVWGTISNTKLTTTPLHDKINYVTVYDGKYWALSTDPAQPSYVSSGIGAGLKTWTAITTGPLASSALYCDTYAVYLDRLFIAVREIENGIARCRVYYSVAGNFADWSIANGGGFFDVGSGSGGRINFFHVMYNMLYIFTKFETYSYTYNTDPNVDGALQPVSKQGANLGVYIDDKLYVSSDSGLYRFINNSFVLYPLKAEIKYYGITCLKGFDNYLFISSTIPEDQVYVIDTTTGALMKWDFSSAAVFDTKGTTELFTTGLDGVVFTYNYFTTADTLSYIPSRHAFVPQNEFYDIGADLTTYLPYSAFIKTGLIDQGLEGFYKRIYYCTATVDSYGFYDGGISINDTNNLRTSYLGMRVTDSVKMSYPVDRTRYIQTVISYVPTQADSITAAQRVPVKFWLRDFQLVAEAKDIQQGERV